MPPAPAIDLAVTLFAAHETTFDSVRITRDSYGPGEQAAHDLVRAAERAG